MARGQENEAALSSGQLAAAWLDQTGETILHYRGDFHRWECGHYRRIETAWVRNSVCQWMGDSLTLAAVNARLLDDVVSVLAAMRFLDGQQSPPFWDGVAGAPCSANVLVVKNGILVIDSQTLLPHDPALFVLGGTDYDFDPVAKCPKWLAFLDWFTGGDQGVIDFLGEFLAYCLLPDLQLQRFLWLFGDGSNGKGVLLHVVARLFGATNVSRIPLEKFSNRFALAEMVGKRANIIADAEQTDRVSEGILKQITAGDPVAVERKFKDIFDAALTCRIIVCANSLVRFRDQSNGMWRRLIPLPCNAVVQAGDSNFHETLVPELPGILNWVLSFVARLLERRGACNSGGLRSALDEHRGESDPARLFCGEQLELAEHFEFTAAIYEHYCHWMDKNGWSLPKALPTFMKEFKRLLQV